VLLHLVTSVGLASCRLCITHSIIYPHTDSKASEEDVNSAYIQEEQSTPLPYLQGCQNFAILHAQNWQTGTEIGKILQILLSNIALHSSLMAATDSAKHFGVKVIK